MPKIISQIENVGSVELNVRIVLSLNDWEKVVAALSGEQFHAMTWPFFWLRDTLREQIVKARQEFETVKEVER